MPGQDGLSFTRELKSNIETARIPIVALTAHAMKSDEARARAAGCDGYISKPFSPRHLGNLVVGLLSESRQPDSRNEATRDS
ncbi:MAG: response regulator [Thermomicrobiales bacterium]